MLLLMCRGRAADAEDGHAADADDVCPLEPEGQRLGS